MDSELFHLSIDPDLDSYRSFFDHDWAKEMGAIADVAPKLKDPVFGLLFAWKGAARTRELPYLAVLIAEQFSAGVGSLRLDHAMSLKVMLFLSEHLDQQLTFDSAQKAEVRRVMLELAERAKAKVEGQSVPFPREELWAAFLKDKSRAELVLSLAASQRICFAALYHAYEDFLTRCLRIQQSDPELRVFRQDEFKKALRESFGEKLKIHCWDDRPVHIARLVRHALSHEGGRETTELKKAGKHGFEVSGNGSLQILPEHLNMLFDALKVRAQALSEHAATLQEFK